MPHNEKNVKMNELNFTVFLCGKAPKGAAGLWPCNFCRAFSAITFLKFFGVQNLFYKKGFA